MDFKILPTDVVLCAIAKNENNYIEEWVQWYFNLGFDKIYIFDDNEDERALPSLPLINEYVEAGKIHIEYCGKEKINYKQMVKYKNFYTQNKFAWCAFFDIDEFLVLKQHKNIKEYLSMDIFSNFSAISICWEMYGDNGHLKKEKGGVVERFPEPFTGDTNGISDVYNGDKMLVKKIIRGGIKNIEFPNPHAVRCVNVIRCCDEKGSSVSSAKFAIEKTYKYAKINHYFTKSAEEYANKVKRGRAAQKSNVFRKMDEYFSINPKTQDRIDALREAFGYEKKDETVKYFGNQPISSKKKILFLVMSCNKPDFIKEEDIVRETWAKEIVNNEFENIDLYFYRATKEKEIHVDKDVIFIPSRDDWNGTYDKTLKCFKYILANKDFDYVVRTNTSNYINVKCLVDMINNIPENDTNIYGTRLIINNTSRGYTYFRGNCLVLKKSIVKDIVDAEISSIREADDGAMAYTLVVKYTKNGIDYHEKLRQFPISYVYTSPEKFKYDFDTMKDSVCFRLKTSPQANRNSKLIISKMKKMDAIIRAEERKFVAPTKFNTDYVESLYGRLSFDDAMKRSKKKLVQRMPTAAKKIKSNGNVTYGKTNFIPKRLINHHIGRLLV